MTEVTLASWQNLGCDLGAEHWSDTVFLELVARYSERHRHYHTLQHLRECFAHVDAVPKLVRFFINLTVIFLSVLQNPFFQIFWLEHERHRAV